MSDVKTLERRYYEAFNARNLSAYEELFTEDCEVLASGGIALQGVEAMRAFDRSWHDAFPDCIITLDGQIAEGDTVVSENTFRGTHTGVFSTPAGDIPPTNANVEGHYVVVVKARDGRISSFRAYLDRLELLEALGLVPAPQSA